MKFIANDNITDPRINLALEEYALLNVDINEDHLLFYINEPAIIIGKHQNTIEEINTDYIEPNHIHVVRRISGGGAVYHDFGNLNFSFISKADNHIFNRYETFTKPIIQALHELGVPAELNGRNDIIVQGRKISGNAQYQRGDRMFCHGTLLFDSQLENLVVALKVKPDKIASKGIKSIRSRVANIKEFLPSAMNIQAFKQHLLDYIFQQQHELKLHTFTASDWQAIHKLAKAKYSAWDWNYGRSPLFNLQRRKRFSSGEIDVRLQIEQGHIISIKLYGDFFAKNDITELETLLTNIPYQKAAIEKTLNSIPWHNYFSGIDKKEFIELIC